MKNKVKFPEVMRSMALITFVMITGLGIAGCDLFGGKPDNSPGGAADPVTDTAVLEGRIGRAEALKKGVEVIEETDPANVPPDVRWVTQAEMDAFNGVIAAAENKFANAATQTEINNANAALTTAMNVFNVARKTGAKSSDFTPEQADKLIEKAEAAKGEDENAVTVSVDGSDVDPSQEWVTPAAMDALEAALEALEAAIESEVQTAIDDAYLALVEALKAFEEAIQPGMENPDHAHQWGGWTPVNAVISLTFEIRRECATGNHSETENVTLAEYLEDYATGGETAADPIPLTLAFDLGDMTAETDGWQTLLGMIDTGGKFVGLDLLDCTMSGKVFDPLRLVSTGKNRIVAITLPAAGTTMKEGSSALGSLYTHFSYFANLASVIIPDSYTAIPDCAFYTRTTLKSVTIPDSVEIIDYMAFYGCTGLTSIIIPDSVTFLGDTWGNSSVFQGCTGLTSVTIGNSVTSIGRNTFNGCTALTGVTIGNSVTSIDEGAFRGCTALTGIDIPDSVTSISNNAFQGCTGLTGTLAIPDSVESIDMFAFAGCTSLTSIDIPDSVTSISNNAFQGCTGLTSVTIGSGVESIGYDAFDGCTGLTSVAIRATTPPVLTTWYETFDNTNNCPIYVPNASLNAYKTASGWSTYAARIQGGGF